MNLEIVRIIAKLEQYCQQGFMDRYEIEEIVEALTQANNKENEQRIHRMMDDLTNYIIRDSNSDYCLNRFVRENMDAVAKQLERSKRTIYRKLQSNSFTLVEKRKIQKMMENAE